MSPYRSNAVAEENPSPHKWDEMCTVDSPPALLCHRQEPEGISRPFWREPAPLVTRCRRIHNFR